MPIYGRQNNSAAVASGTTDTNTTNVRASVFDPMPQHGWAHRFGMRLGTESGGTVQVRGHLWATSSSGNPGSLLASTAQIAQSQSYTYSTAPYADVAGDLTSIARLTSGSAYAVGFAATGSTRHGQTASGDLMYMRSAGTTGPFNPLGYTSSSPQGLLDNFVLYDANVAPSVPGSLYPVGQISNQSPAFTGTFRDANETVNGRNNKANERLNHFRVQLRQVGSSTLLWDSTYGAPEDQKVARAFSAGYGGSGSLTPGVTYEWRSAVSDAFDAFSAWTGWTSFSINPGGSVSTPTGGGRKTTRQPTGFVSTWSHIAGLSMDAYNPQILQNGVVVRDFGTRVVGAQSAPGGTIDVLGGIADWTNTGTAQLDWGQSYTIRVRGRDTGGVWSPFSSGLAFTTNYPPTTPAPAYPLPNGVFSQRPMLSSLMTDPDNTPATGLQGFVRIKNNAGTVLFTRQSALSPTGGGWQYQTTATDLPTFAPYRWDAFGTDGVLTTPYSPERPFTYAEGPVIAITSPVPGAIASTPTLGFAYTVTDQASRQAKVYRAGEDAPLITFGTVVSTTDKDGAVGLQDIPNNTDLELTITVTNSSGLTAESPRVPFRLQYPPAPPITGFTASPELAAGDREPSVVRLTWNPSTITSGFDKYRVFRNAPFDPTDLGQTLIVEITSISQTEVIDAQPANGVVYHYTIDQFQRLGVSVVGSGPFYAGPIQLDFHAVIISDAADPGRRVVLPYVRDPERGFTDDRRLVDPWSGGPPVLLTGGAVSRTVRATYQLIANPEQQLAAIQQLSGERSDGSVAVLNYRNHLGLAMTGTIMGLSARAYRNRIDAQFTFQELRS